MTYRVAEPGDDEQGVVDTEGEGEHHREVHRPHGNRGDLVEQNQAARRGDEPGQGQQQWEPGGDEGPEGEHHDREGDRPGKQFGLNHRVVVGLVEITPQCRCAGGIDLDAVPGQGGQLPP